MALLSAFQIQLGRYTGLGQFAIGSPSGGRSHRCLEALIGYLVNPLAFVADLSGDPTFSEFLARVKHTAEGTFDNSDVPFTRVAELAAPDREASYSPVFQVMFTLAERAPFATRALGQVRRQLPALPAGKLRFLACHTPVPHPRMLFLLRRMRRCGCSG